MDLNLIRSLFTKIAPIVLPLTKQISMKAIGVIHDKATGFVGDLAGKAFSTVKDILIRLIHKPQPVHPVKLTVTEIMPVSVGKVINQLANKYNYPSKVEDLMDNRREILPRVCKRGVVFVSDD